MMHRFALLLLPAAMLQSVGAQGSGEFSSGSGEDMPAAPPAAPPTPPLCPDGCELQDTVSFDITGPAGTFVTVSRRQLRGLSTTGIACPAATTKAECEAAVKAAILATSIGDDVVDVVVTIQSGTVANIELIIDAAANAAAGKLTVAQIRDEAAGAPFASSLGAALGATISVSNVVVGTTVVTQSPSPPPSPPTRSGDDDDDVNADADDDEADHDNDDDSGVVSEDDDDDKNAARIVGGSSSRDGKKSILEEGKASGQAPLLAGLAKGMLFGVPVGAMLIAAGVYKHYKAKGPVAPFKELDDAPTGRPPV